MVQIPFPPTRIISLVPSQTEWLYDLGLEEEVIGITRFCVHPQKWFHTKTRVGGTKQLHLEKIRQLQPHLILANKEENEKAQLEQLMQEFPVWISDIHTFTEALDMMQIVGRMTNRESKAIEIIHQITTAFDHLQTYITTLKANYNPRAAYFIWYNPWMVAASNTFIDDMLQRCRLQNAFTHLTRYPQITESDIQRANPDIILLSSEPFPFKPKHQQLLQTILPHAKYYFVDGEMFAWYGSRLLYAADYCRKLIEKIFCKSNL
ncbi:ABC transporter substrate-binding protein [Thermoflavifilum thermophilum]|nr:helical backbone metal receptor [Thermoflavifilum thermophilum]